MDKQKKNLGFYMRRLLIGGATGLANGLFGAGGGMVVVPALTYLMKTEEHRAHATAIAVILPLTVLSAVFYLHKGFIDWRVVLPVSLGGVAGGYAGARLLGLCPAKLLRRIFAVFMIAAAIKMIL